MDKVSGFYRATLAERLVTWAEASNGLQIDEWALDLDEKQSKYTPSYVIRRRIDCLGMHARVKINNLADGSHLNWDRPAHQSVEKFWLGPA